MVRRSAGVSKDRPGTVVNVSLWHNVRAQLGAFEGTKTASLPKFVRECRLSGGNDT